MPAGEEVTIALSGIEDVSTERLEAKIRSLARRLFAREGMDDLEAWYLAQVVDHCSRAISDIYRTVDLERILRGLIPPPATPDRGGSGKSGPNGSPLWRRTGAPDALRGLGDRCLYDVGMAGLLDYRGVSLETLGVSSYRMAADLLAVLANEHELRELFQRNRVRTLPIEEEIVFLHRCATRFGLHARLLQTLREERAATVPSAADGPGLSPASPHPDRKTVLASRAAPPVPWVPRAEVHRSPAENRLLLNYERILLLAGTDLEEIRRRLRAEVIDQDAAVDALCDDLLLYAAGARGDRASPAYLLVGPPGVGRRHLMERLARNFEAQWGVEVPVLVIQGSEDSGRSPDADGRGRARAARRRGAPEILEPFLDRSTKAPLSILIVDGAEHVPSGLQRHLLRIVMPAALPKRRYQEAGAGLCLVALTLDLRTAGAETGGRTGDLIPEHPEIHGGRLRSLPPELQSRLRALRFAPLSRRARLSLLDREISRVREWVRSLHGLEIVVTGRARDRLLELGFSDGRGARDLEATVRRHCTLEAIPRLEGEESIGRRLRDNPGRVPVGGGVGSPILDAGQCGTRGLFGPRFRRRNPRLIIDTTGKEFLYRRPGSR